MSINKDGASCLNLRALLAKTGARFTSQRKLILDCLLSEGTHQSAETIYRSLKRKFPMIGRATVFRTLKLLENVGLCQRMPERSRFEPKAGREHHDHMICLKCGAVLEFSNNKTTNYAKQYR